MPPPHMKLFSYEVGRGSLLILGGDEKQWQEHLSSAPYLPGPTSPFGGPCGATYLAAVLMAASRVCQE